MFETAEIERPCDPDEYAREVPGLRLALISAQKAFEYAKTTSIVVVVAGVPGAGKGDAVNLLNDWLDPRGIHTHGMAAPTDEERIRPYLFRFFRRLPPKGQIAIFFDSWYAPPVAGRVLGGESEAQLDAAMERIRRFERMLVHEDVVLLKLWFHLSKADLKSRIKMLLGDPLTAWRVDDRERTYKRHYDAFTEAGAHALRRTDDQYAPWHLVPGIDPRARNLRVARAMLAALQRGPEPSPSVPVEISKSEAESASGVLSTLDLSPRVKREKYERKLPKRQREVNLLVRDPRFRQRSLIVVFEGMDAAGKGSAIRRLTQAMDARTYDIVPVSAPSDEERARPYLWRFWRHAPRHQKVLIFDRSWYGRVLVERVEALSPESAWMRAFAEINDFEEQLVENGSIVCKFWLHIDPNEQLRRFRKREATPHKRHKITHEDWRNRAKWDEYVGAAERMIAKTSTEVAPWTVVPANDKRFARLNVLATIAEALRAAL